MVVTQAASPKTSTKTLTNTHSSMNCNDEIIPSSTTSKIDNKQEVAKQNFIIYHQNIHGLNGKTDELVISIASEMPHLICLTEHHLKDNEIDVVHIPNYILGARYCRTNLKCGGIGIYIHKNINYSNINLLSYCKEQDIEIVAVELKFTVKNVIVLCVYRAPGGNLDHFLDQLDSILNRLDNPKSECIICGDLNINFIANNIKKTKLENLLNTYNLIGTVSFPTRITDSSFSAIDNILVDKKSNYTIKPCINGLSDHDAQLLTIKDVTQTVNITQPIIVRNINKSTIIEFLNLLSVESWEDVFGTNDVNIMFKNFLNMYIRGFNACFLKINKSTSKLAHCGWLTNGVKISCKRKKELYILCKIIKNYNLKQYYKKYCKILTNVIRNAKKLYYNNIIR